MCALKDQPERKGTKQKKERCITYSVGWFGWTAPSIYQPDIFFCNVRAVWVQKLVLHQAPLNHHRRVNVTHETKICNMSLHKDTVSGHGRKE